MKFKIILKRVKFRARLYYLFSNYMEAEIEITTDRTVEVDVGVTIDFRPEESVKRLSNRNIDDIVEKSVGETNEIQ